MATPRKKQSTPRVTHRKRKNGVSPTVLHADIRIADLVTLLPESTVLLEQYGLHCAGCALNGFDTLAEGMRLHGYNKEETTELLAALRSLLSAPPSHPQDLTITSAAAHALHDLLHREKKATAALLVTLDERGGFCMEFIDALPQGALHFHNREVPDVHVYATPLTLRRIGGSTIDVREGRFKLDAPDAGCTCHSENSSFCKQ